MVLMDKPLKRIWNYGQWDGSVVKAPDDLSLISRTILDCGTRYSAPGRSLFSIRMHHDCVHLHT